MFSPNTAGSFEDATTSDVTPTTYDSMYIGVTGDLALENGVGDVVIFKNVPSGAILPVRGYKVMATGTTASALIGLND